MSFVVSGVCRATGGVGRQGSQDEVDCPLDGESAADLLRHDDTHEDRTEEQVDDGSPIPGAVSAEEGAEQAVANLSNGPTWFVGDLLREGAQRVVTVDALVLGADNRHGIRAVGFYDDDLVRTDGGWRIARRRYTMVHLQPVSDGVTV